MRVNYFSIITTIILSATVFFSGCSKDDKDNNNGNPVNNPEPPFVNDTTLDAFYFVGTTDENGSELWKTNGDESNTSLIKDIGPTASSNPNNFIQFGDAVFFTANDGVNGNELWKYQNNTATLVHNIHPTGSSNIQNLTVHNGKLYFIADSDTAAGALWESTGFSDGLQQVGTFNFVSNLVSTSSGLYFFTSGNALWFYDGVTLPTEQINLTNAFTSATKAMAVSDKVFFIASDFDRTTLWMSDGSDLGTVEVADAAPAAFVNMDSNYSQLFSVNGKLVFTTMPSGFNLELWVYDPATPAAGRLLTDTNATILVYRQNFQTQVRNGDVYFTSPNRYLWKTDGTTTGTSEVTRKFSSPQKVASTLDGTVYVYANGRLWKTNGTDTGTINLNLWLDNPWDVAGNLVYFTRDYDGVRTLMATDGTGNPPTRVKTGYYANFYGGLDKLYMSYSEFNGFEPWVSDGTPSGTFELADINQLKYESSYPGSYVVLNRVLFIITYDDSNGYRSLWRSDGTTDGTFRLSDEARGVDNLTIYKNKVYFTAYDADHGYELWESNGSKAETKMAFDFYTGPQSSRPYSLTVAGDYLYFVDNNADLLWKTNGTLEGTSLVKYVEPDSQIIAVGNKIYFSVYNGSGNDLWVSDGSLDGTHIVENINPNGSGFDSDWTISHAIIGDDFYFLANDGTHGVQLWKTNATENTSQMITQFDNQTNVFEDSEDTQIYTDGQDVYFTVLNASGNEELWKTNSGESNVVKLTNFGDTGSLRSNTEIVAYKGYVYFSADNGTSGIELWRSNGQPVSAELFKDIYMDPVSASGSSRPYGFSVHNDSLYFFAQDYDNNQQLWKTDGDPNNTNIVYNLYTDLDGYAEPFYEANSDSGYGCYEC